MTSFILSRKHQPNVRLNLHASKWNKKKKAHCECEHHPACTFFPFYSWISTPPRSPYTTAHLLSSVARLQLLDITPEHPASSHTGRGRLNLGIPRTLTPSPRRRPSPSAVWCCFVLFNQQPSQLLVLHVGF